MLSPFDNLVIQRKPTRALFDFDYQLECYVPEARRQFGYYCLPLLYRDRLVGRADCKAHRRGRTLEIRRLFVEHPRWLGGDPDTACHAIARALAHLADHNGCAKLELGAVEPAHLHRALAGACVAINEETS